MSLVNVTGVDVRNNPAALDMPFEFEVCFECLEPLESDLEWKLIYVGSADNKDLDQELDCIVMGPIHRGALKFTFEAAAPDFSKIPNDDIVGFTIALLTGSYRDEEFIRIGWYVHNVYVDEALQEDAPDIPNLAMMQRIILTEAPRVTRFKISWDGPKLDSSNYSNMDTIPEGDSREEAALNDTLTGCGPIDTGLHTTDDRQNENQCLIEKPDSAYSYSTTCPNFNVGSQVCLMGGMNVPQQSSHQMQQPIFWQPQNCTFSSMEQNVCGHASYSSAVLSNDIEMC